jgi:hypothetical protein
MEAVDPCETSVTFNWTTRRYSPENSALNRYYFLRWSRLRWVGLVATIMRTINQYRMWVGYVEDQDKNGRHISEIYNISYKGKFVSVSEEDFKGTKGTRQRSVVSFIFRPVDGPQRLSGRSCEQNNFCRILGSHDASYLLIQRSVVRWNLTGVSE